MFATIGDPVRPAGRRGETWVTSAACRGADAELFFKHEDETFAARIERENAAKEVCQRCPVRAECLQHALEANERFGIWGGLTPLERRSYARRAG